MLNKNAHSFFAILLAFVAAITSCGCSSGDTSVQEDPADILTIFDITASDADKDGLFDAYVYYSILTDHAIKRLTFEVTPYKEDGTVVSSSSVGSTTSLCITNPNLQSSSSDDVCAYDPYSKSWRTNLSLENFHPFAEPFDKIVVNDVNRFTIASHYKWESVWHADGVREVKAGNRTITLPNGINHIEVKQITVEFVDGGKIKIPQNDIARLFKDVKHYKNSNDIVNHASFRDAYNAYCPEKELTLNHEAIKPGNFIYGEIVSYESNKFDVIFDSSQVDHLDIITSTTEIDPGSNSNLFKSSVVIFSLITDPTDDIANGDYFIEWLRTCFVAAKNERTYSKILGLTTRGGYIIITVQKLDHDDTSVKFAIFQDKGSSETETSPDDL